MVLETVDGLRVEISGDPRTGGVAVYDSRDGAVSGVVAFETADYEIGRPLRFTWAGTTTEFGDVVNALRIFAG